MHLMINRLQAVKSALNPLLESGSKYLSIVTDTRTQHCILYPRAAIRRNNPTQYPPMLIPTLTSYEFS